LSSSTREVAEAEAIGFHVVIPARYGAVRLPGKPLIDIGGRPLIGHVWDRAKASGAADVVVATDDDRVADACRAFGADVELTSSEHASGSDRVAEVIARRGWSGNDIVVNLQGDEPCMPPALIDQVAADLASHGVAAMATLCAPIGDAKELFDPHAVKVVLDAEGFALYFSRAPMPWHRDEFLGSRARLPRGVLFLRHIGLYAYRADFLTRFVGWPAAPLELAEALEQLRVLWHGERIHVTLAGEPPGPGVDTPDDIARVKTWLGVRGSRS
jgi:3-deoxy-manno-octulosonate cytidylyltransferase (CMP-KDO synthetase)